MIWNMYGTERELFLTFDDGPVPEITPWIMDQLDRYYAKASFFCVGQNIEKNPVIFDNLVSAGHSIGNHSFNHLSGWTTGNINYINNVHKGAAISNSNLFRPPYGRIRPSQFKVLKHYYKLIMWDVLSGDFDPSISPAQCFENVTRNAIPGSIVVFHDSIKSKAKVMEVLPRVLKYYSERGFQFNSLKSVESPVEDPAKISCLKG